VTVSFDADGLTTGTYTTTLVINSDDPNENPVTVPVELTVGTFPDIEVTPTSLAATLALNQSVNRTLTINNLGGADLDWALTESVPASWLSALPIGPATIPPAGSDTVVVSFDASGLEAGTSHTTTLVIGSNDPNEATVEVPVSLSVEPCQEVTIQDVVSDSPVKIGETMHFSATVTGTEPYSYVWDFGAAGSGTGGDTAIPTWTYVELGTHTVSLTVTNPCATDVYTLDVQVEEHELLLPIVAKNYSVTAR
jgi:PKD repeat protein